MRVLSEADIIFILMAARWTLLLSVVALVGGGILGALVTLARTGTFAWLRNLTAAYIKIFQGTPLLMQLFLAYFVPGIFGWHVDPWVAASLGLSLHASAFLGEIWRGSIQAVPKGQSEAARSLGLGYFATTFLVIVPQAIRLATPPTIGFLVQLIKGTSLASIIGFVELTRSAQIVNNATFRPFLVFTCVAIVYFIICFPLSLWSKRLEDKLAVKAR